MLTNYNKYVALVRRDIIIHFGEVEFFNLKKKKLCCQLFSQKKSDINL